MSSLTTAREDTRSLPLYATVQDFQLRYSHNIRCYCIKGFCACDCGAERNERRHRVIMVWNGYGVRGAILRCGTDAFLGG